jgi:putative FmdB family regulatory protein
MPIYEYQCQACGHELEKLQRMSDSSLTDCPDCGEEELRRLVSAAGFRLKGAGWYETDFKMNNKKNLHDAGDSGSGAPKSGSSATKTPAKSAEKKNPESKPAEKKINAA